MGPIEKTTRGFRVASFTDAYGERCSVQESSAIADEVEGAYLWLGAEERRMHLSQAQIIDLLPILQHFALHAEMPPPAAPAPQERHE